MIQIKKEYIKEFFDESYKVIIQDWLTYKQLSKKRLGNEKLQGM